MMPAIISPAASLWLAIVLAVCLFVAGIAFAALTMDSFIEAILNFHNREAQKLREVTK